MKSKLILAVVALFLTIPAFAQGATHSVTLTWTPTTSTGSTYGYNVYRGTTAGRGSDDAYYPAHESEHPARHLHRHALHLCVDSDTALTAGVTYFYTVKTVDLTSKGTSGASNETSAMIPIVVTIPNPPTNLKITISQ